MAMRRARIAAEVHLKFVCELYQEQIDGGRYFLHEHPMWATSWLLDCVDQIMRQEGVQKVRGDQCMYGAETKSGANKGQPIMKPTGFMTNSAKIALSLSARCAGETGQCSRPGGGRHQTCSGRHAKEASKYPRKLCEAILKGVRDQMRADDILNNGCFGCQAPDDGAEIERQMRGPAQG